MHMLESGLDQLPWQMQYSPREQWRNEKLSSAVCEWMVQFVSGVWKAKYPTMR